MAHRTSRVGKAVFTVYELRFWKRLMLYYAR